MPPATPPPTAGRPRADLEMTEDLVQQLLREQHPSLAHLPVIRQDAGWDNELFRLGESLAVRLPRRAVAAQLTLHEQTWLPVLAPHLPLPVPVPLYIGTGSSLYPWPWSILPWLSGEPADLQPPEEHQAEVLGAFLHALHQPAPELAPANPVRGVPLTQRQASMEERMVRLSAKTDLITPRLRQLWHEALEVPLTSERRWLHGDLHPQNVLVSQGVISGIIDWGDLTAGDVATDLASLWMLFASPRAREQALNAYGGISEETFRRAQGWAVMFGVALLDSGLINSPRHAAIGERTLRRLLKT